MIFLSCNNNKIEQLNHKIEANNIRINKIESELKLKEATIEYLKEQIEIINLEQLKKANNLPLLFSKVRNAVYLIQVIDNNKEASEGSAFSISEDGIAISNYHVFKNASKLKAFNNNGQEYLITEIIEENKSLDYVIFRLGPLSGPISFLSISEEVPDVGENVFTIGNPLGFKQTLSSGIISGYRPEKSHIQTTAEITYGSSGGPLFNELGKVIGVTTEGMGKANLNFAIEIKKLNLERYTNTKPELTSTSIDENQLIQIMNKFYDNLINENIENLSGAYANTLARFHSLYSVNKSEVMKDHKNYFSVYDVKKAKIVPESFLYFKNRNSYTLQYKLDYTIFRIDNKKEFNYTLESVVEINEKGEISSVYDNILIKK